MNLSAGGGYAVWAQPGEDTGWQLVVRAPDGTVSTPDVPGFASPPDLTGGTGGTGGTAGEGRSLLAVYSRPSGGDEDLYALDLRSGREHRVAPVSSAGADEVHPSVQFGRLVFVRRGGSCLGVYVWNGRAAPRPPRPPRPSTPL